MNGRLGKISSTTRRPLNNNMPESSINSKRAPCLRIIMAKLCPQAIQLMSEVPDGFLRATCHLVFLGPEGGQGNPRPCLRLCRLGSGCLLHHGPIIKGREPGSLRIGCIVAHGPPFLAFRKHHIGAVHGFQQGLAAAIVHGRATLLQHQAGTISMQSF